MRNRRTGGESNFSGVAPPEAGNDSAPGKTEQRMFGNSSADVEREWAKEAGSRRRTGW
jgi:hypothetical protein